MLTPVIILCTLGIASLLVAASVKRIPEGHVYTLHRWGNPQPRLLSPGVHWVLPLIEHIVHKISLAGRTLNLDAEVASDAGTRSHAVRGAVYWQVLEPQRAEAVIDHVDDLILRCALQALALGDYSAGPRNNQLKQALNDELRERGMLVTRVDLQVAESHLNSTSETT